MLIALGYFPLMFIVFYGEALIVGLKLADLNI